jgi:hypothetical protein
MLMQDYIDEILTTPWDGVEDDIAFEDIDDLFEK